MASLRHGLLCVLVLVLCQSSIEAKKRAAPKRRQLIAETGKSDEKIWETGLVEKEVTAANIFEKGQTYHKDYKSGRRLTGMTLGYVTPWNAKGYDLSVKFRSKLTHVSPVWYSLKRDSENGVWRLEGRHNKNDTWYNAVRKPVKGHKVRVVPRVLVDLDDPQDHLLLLTDPAEALQKVMDEVLWQEYDGIVFEVALAWTVLNVFNSDIYRPLAIQCIKWLSEALRTSPYGELGLIMAIPPLVPSAHQRPFMDKSVLTELEKDVKYWSVMTYDFVLSLGPQPNAPMPWLEQQIKLLKDNDPNRGGPAFSNPNRFLLGLNFYGYDWVNKPDSDEREAITYEKYFKLLSDFQPELKWEAGYEEHSFEYTPRVLNTRPHKVYYPTPRSLEMRLELAAKEATGVAIWELGQGYERFFDLL